MKHLKLFEQYTNKTFADFSPYLYDILKKHVAFWHPTPEFITKAVGEFMEFYYDNEEASPQIRKFNNFILWEIPSDAITTGKSIDIGEDGEFDLALDEYRLWDAITFWSGKYEDEELEETWLTGMNQENWHKLSFYYWAIYEANMPLEKIKIALVNPTMISGFEDPDIERFDQFGFWK